jgi:rhodanese-related sulfurtransferase
VDVRTKSEFEQGHIPNATLVESLASAGTSSEVTNASALFGCEQCNIAVYCRSGARADVALAYLEQNGFVSLFDAQGINQWLDSNRTLVTNESQVPPCVAAPTGPSTSAKTTLDSTTGIITLTVDEFHTKWIGQEFGVIIDVRPRK